MLIEAGTARVMRHAVGIDERRAKFRQDLINKVDAFEIERQRTWKAEWKDRKLKRKRSRFLPRPSASSIISRSPRSTNSSMRSNSISVQGMSCVDQAAADAISNVANGRQSPAGESMMSLNILMDLESDSDEEDEMGQDIEEVSFEIICSLSCGN